MLDDDAVIAQSWQQPERFAVLFDRHAAYIHRYLARRAGPQAAEDLVAETFLTAFRKRRRYQPGYANARPWLYGIATHLAGQHHRDQARQYRLHQAARPPGRAPADRAAAGDGGRAAPTKKKGARRAGGGRGGGGFAGGGVRGAAAGATAAGPLVAPHVPASPPVLTARLTAEQILDR